MSRQFAESVESAQAKRKKYQRMLIPANIIVIIIAVIAIFCQMMMPMVKIEIALTQESFSAVIESMETEEGESSIPREDLEYILQDVEANIAVEITPSDAMRLGVSPSSQDVKDFVAGKVEGLSPGIEDALSQAMPRLLAYVTASTAGAGNLADSSVEGMKNVVDLISAGSYGEAKAQFPAAAQEYAASLGYSLGSDDLQELTEMFDTMVDSGISEDGSFSYLAALSAMGGEGHSSGDSSGYFDLSELSESLFEGMSEEEISLIGTAIFAVFAVFIAFTSALWAIMALIAFLRIFMRNRRFTMWYVKLFCLLPCLLFVIAPTVALMVAPGLVEEAAAILTSVVVRFGGSGIVSGICYALLWLVSIFWCFPIKRKIRKLNRFIKDSRYD